MTDSTALADAGPNDQLVFSVVAKNEFGEDVLLEYDRLRDNTYLEFAPEFYPDRFNKVMEKELNRDGQQCNGEDISIKTFKNSDIHANGVCLARNVSIIEELHKHEGKVDLYTPISPNGGLEAYVKKAEVGEIDGWNPHKQEWMFQYTLDFVSTGFDEYGTDGTNDVVSSMLS
jgi:hypothetical protein